MHPYWLFGHLKHRLYNKELKIGGTGPFINDFLHVGHSLFGFYSQTLIHELQNKLWQPVGEPHTTGSQTIWKQIEPKFSKLCTN